MKLMTRDTDYALRALLYMAKNKDKIVSVTELTKSLKIPRPFLRKILQILHKNKVLTAYKGKGGGFRLAIPAKKILMVDVIKIFQGDFKLNECIFRKKICPNIKVCVVKRKIEEIEEYVVKKLNEITIASLLKDTHE